MNGVEYLGRVARLDGRARAALEELRLASEREDSGRDEAVDAAYTLLERVQPPRSVSGTLLYSRVDAAIVSRELASKRAD